MGWFRNMKIGKKLISSFLFLAIITALVAGTGILFISQITTADTHMYENETRPIAVLSSIRQQFQQARVETRDIVMASSSSEIDKYAQSLADTREQFAKYAGELEKSIATDTEQMKTLYSQFSSVRADYIKDLDTLTELAKSNNDTEATALLRGSMLTSATAEMDAIEAMVNCKLTDADNMAISNQDSAKIAKTIMYFIMGASVVIAILLGTILSRMLSKPMKEMVDVANKIASDNLDVKITYSGKDEIGQLANAFSLMISNLNTFVGNVRTSTEQVAYGSRQVAASSQALSEGATEQASSVEELTSSVEQISVQTQQNATRAGEASNISLVAKTDAVQGIEHMKGMLKAMDDINEASANISKIIKVIDDIAFQTNILALNAAVEAARAGQHGKGFAVVAEEVRTLAARSANAANETTALIEGSIKKAEGGTKIASETAAALEKIADGVTKAADLVEQLAVASNEQSSGIAQINKAISQVSDVIQTNSATAEESAAASEELSGQADILKEMIARFKLKNQTSAPRAEKTVQEPVESVQENTAAKPPVSINLGDASYGKYAY